MNDTSSRPRHLVVIGASAGGIDPLRELVAALPADFPGAVAVVVHVSPQSPGALRHILARAARLPCTSPVASEVLRAGTVYVAPPDYHLLVVPGRVCVTKGPKENRFRPAIDPLFRSAAQVFGPNAIGVVLSGNLDDGAAGLWAIKRMGGVAIVQSPAEAQFPSMPRSALCYVPNADHVVSVATMPNLLAQLTAVPERAHVSEFPEHLEIELEIAKQEDPLAAGVKRLGRPSEFTCPECHGVLLELEEEGHVRFRCHTGHEFSLESLLAEIHTAIEAKLWDAIRVMQEGDMLMRAMASHAGESHAARSFGELIERAKQLERQMTVLRQMVTSTGEPGRED